MVSSSLGVISKTIDNRFPEPPAISLGIPDMEDIEYSDGDLKTNPQRETSEISHTSYGLGMQNLARLAGHYIAAAAASNAGKPTGTANSSNEDPFNVLLRQYNELQQKTTEENLRMRKAQIFQQHHKEA